MAMFENIDHTLVWHRRLHKGVASADVGEEKTISSLKETFYQPSKWNIRFLTTESVAN